MSLTREEIAALCTAGVRAPSGGNAQPWRVTVTGDRIEVRAAEDRGSFLDVNGFAAYFAVGCFTENVTVAADARGLEHTVAVREGTATITVTGRRALGLAGSGPRSAATRPDGAGLPGRPASASDRDPGPSDSAVERRVTNRRLHQGPLLPEDEVRRVTALAEPPFAVTAVADPPGKQAVAGALALADVIRMRHRAMFDDMVREIRWTDGEARAHGDGLDLRTLDLPAASRALLPVLRRLPWLRLALPAARLGDTARALVHGSSHVCCLSSTDPPTPDTMVAAGRATERLWLAATRAGLALHPWTVSTLELLRLDAFDGEGFTTAERAEVGRMGERLRAAFGLPEAAWPVFVFRLSSAPPPDVRALRQPWETFTTIQEVAGD